jgi:hypothetical protein
MWQLRSIFLSGRNTTRLPDKQTKSAIRPKIFLRFRHAEAPAKFTIETSARFPVSLIVDSRVVMQRVVAKRSVGIFFGVR